MSTPEGTRPWMTPLLNRLADIAGEAAAVRIGEARACRKIYVPARIVSGHWLADLVGLDAALAISREFGGETLVIPPVLAGSKRRRAAAIAEMNARGFSINEIAASLGIARSTVIEHRARLKGDPPSAPPRQGSLF